MRELFDAPDPIRVGQFLFYLASARNINDDSAADVSLTSPDPNVANNSAAARTRVNP